MSEKMPSPESWTQENLFNQQERVKSDAKSIEQGSAYVMDEGAKEPRLHLTEEALEEPYNIEQERLIAKKIDNLNLSSGDLITINHKKYEYPLDAKFIELSKNRPAIIVSTGKGGLSVPFENITDINKKEE